MADLIEQDKAQSPRASARCGSGACCCCEAQEESPRLGEEARESRRMSAAEFLALLDSDEPIPELVELFRGDWDRSPQGLATRFWLAYYRIRRRLADSLPRNGRCTDCERKRQQRVSGG